MGRIRDFFSRGNATRRNYIQDHSGQATRVSGFPYSTPHGVPRSRRDDSSLFKYKYTDQDFEELVQRRPEARVIAYYTIDTALDKGFKIQRSTGDEWEEADNEFQKIWEKFVMVPYGKARKMANVYGSSVLIYGYKGEYQNLNEPSPETEIEWLLPFSRKDYSKTGYSSGLPRRVTQITLSTAKANLAGTVHESRFTHVIREDLTDQIELNGEPILQIVADALVVLKHILWASGQAAWRGAIGMAKLIAPKDATQANIDDWVAKVDEDMHARSIIGLKTGWDVKELQLKISPGITRNYDIALNEVAAGSRIPRSVLLGAEKGEIRASPADVKQYQEYISTVQTQEMEKDLREIFQKFMDTGQLKEYNDYIFYWYPIAKRTELQDARDNLITKVADRLTESLEKGELDKDDLLKLSSQLRADDATAN